MPKHIAPIVALLADDAAADERTAGSADIVGGRTSLGIDDGTWQEL